MGSPRGKRGVLRSPARILRLFLVSSILVPSALALSATPATAASGPQVDWDCQLIRTLGPLGPVVLFDPRAEVSWAGKKLRFTMWSWSSRDTRKSQAGKTYGTVTSGSSRWKTTPLDLTHEFITGEEHEYKKVVLVVKDSQGHTAKSTCIWKGPVANGW